MSGCGNDTSQLQCMLQCICTTGNRLSISAEGWRISMCPLRPSASHEQRSRSEQQRNRGSGSQSRLSSGLVILTLPTSSHPTPSSSSRIAHKRALELVTDSPSPDLVFQGVPFNFQLWLFDFLPLSFVDCTPSGHTYTMIVSLSLPLTR